MSIAGKTGQCAPSARTTGKHGSVLLESRESGSSLSTWSTDENPCPMKKRPETAAFNDHHEADQIHDPRSCPIAALGMAGPPLSWLPQTTPARRHGAHHGRLDNRGRFSEADIIWSSVSPGAPKRDPISHLAQPIDILPEISFKVGARSAPIRTLAVFNSFCKFNALARLRPDLRFGADLQ